MNESMRVVVVDDEALLRESLTAVLNREADLTVVGDAADAGEAINVCRSLMPDIVLMDIDMPGKVSFYAVREIRASCPNTKILFLSAYFYDRYIEEALAVQASGYLTKHESPDEVITAIRQAAAGEICYSDHVWSRLAVTDKGICLAEADKTITSTLTIREAEALRYVAQGLRKKEISGLMHVSIKTVDKHITSLMRKLCIHDRVELARFAIREHIVKP